MVNKVLLVNRRLSVGGSERVMALIAGAMAERNIKTDMVVMQNLDRVYEVGDKVNIIQFDYDKLNPVIKTIKRIYRLRQIMKKGNYDCIISFLDLINFYTLIAGIGMKNIIVSERNDPRKNVTIVKKIGRKFLYPLANKIVFQTEEAKNCFPENIRRKGHIIPNPINYNLPEPYKGDRKKEIVSFGRFVKQKNFKMAIDAFAKIHMEYPEYILTIYGKGDLKDEMIEYVKEKGLEKSIRFPGFEANIIDKIKKSGIYISSSEFEGISNSMLEAMAMGLPTVCTDCPVGGARMAIRNNENGILVPVGDTDAMYEGIKKIIEDSEFANKLSKNALNIRKELSIDRIIDMWINIMES